MKDHFLDMATYNVWANTRIYRVAARLTDEQYRRNVGVYFKSLHGTLNHLIVADRIWMRRLTGTGDAPTSLDAILFDDLASLTTERQQLDNRILGYVQSLEERQFEDMCGYQTLAGVPQQQRLREILAHVFNHQTHHRGQAHAALTILGITEPDPLDLFLMQREKRQVNEP